MRRYCWLVLILFLNACGDGGKPSDIGPGNTAPDLSDIAVYQSAGPYAEVLPGCATATDTSGYCTLELLPLIGQQVATPAVNDIMERVLVSHPWMAVRFEAALNQLPSDLLSLFRGVTAIVIDSDIRPSFYLSGTAAIYLDPAYLWLTNEEKATISQAADFRDNFGDQLQFIGLWRYVKNNDYAYPGYSLSGTETRQLADILYPLARILYHELAHANDFLTPAMQATLDLQTTPLEASRSLASEQVANQLQGFAPLSSSLWNRLAGVLFHGATPTAQQRGYSAGFVGTEFASDIANDPYNYASIREDVAMLFEETMMKFHFDIDRDLAFTDRPLPADPVCDDHLVQWGVRNRLGDPLVKARAGFIAGELLPSTDLSTFLDDFPEPTALTTGIGWCSNLNPGGITPLDRQQARAINPGQLAADLRSPEF